MKRFILPTILLVALAAAAGIYIYGRLHPKNTNTLSVSGNLELTQVDISFKVPGKLIQLNVDEGYFVKKGQVIARIDRDQVDSQRARDEASLHNSQSQYDQMETSVQWQRRSLESDVALRTAELHASQARLAALVAGSRPQEIQESRAAMADAKAQHDQAQADWDRAQDLFKNDDISKQQYDQYRMRLDSTAAVLRQSDERLGLVVEGPRKEDIDAARADVVRAQAAVESAQANRLELKRREQDVFAHRADVSRARAQVAITDTQINDTFVTAPIDGVVLVKSAEVGEVLAAGTTVVTIGDIDHPWLRAYINETDLGRVKYGQPASLATDSFPGKSYPGRISFIASEAEFTPKQIQTNEERVKLVYRIKIDVDNRTHDLKSNMPVDAQIQIQ
ncbi:MAG TPA: HlyD family efflux transporter periplasmic adaptor subunit [Bryobacteraceae bacterium]|jgi:HlyD family secretion protein|nr:HlyD family efflux transporter periplasmic adaptor subunit [Bryobacteraceae bacterium]